MKALTIWQPWASLIIVGAKPFEFRGWPAPAFVVGHRIAIHAGARAVKRTEVQQLLDDLHGPNAGFTCLVADIAVPLLARLLVEPDAVPRSAVIGTALLGASRNGFDVAREFGVAVNDSSRAEHANWAWPLSEIEPRVPPTEARGAQGFWNWGGA